MGKMKEFSWLGSTVIDYRGGGRGIVIEENVPFAGMRIEGIVRVVYWNGVEKDYVKTLKFTKNLVPIDDINTMRKHDEPFKKALQVAAGEIAVNTNDKGWFDEVKLLEPEKSE